jgi:manganese oxidase
VLARLSRHTPSRRHFLRTSALGLAGTALAACAREEEEEAVPPAPDRPGTHDGRTPPSSAEAEWREMDRKHEEGVRAFPAPTQGVGMQPLPHRLVNGVKEFELTCERVDWEVEPGRFSEAWCYNGQLPGPLIRVTEGDRIRVVVHNHLHQSTAVHWHHQHVPNDMDGVPFITQPPIEPGQSFTYEFTADPYGSHMYHSHYNATEQVTRGLLGPLIVDPRNAADEPEYDDEWIIVLNDAAHGYTINGKGFPATHPKTVRRGTRLRIRFMNEGLMIHPMHLHGMPMRAFARDGRPLPQPFECDTLNIVPGERWDVTVDCDAPGTWVFHCHVLSHAEGPHGMFGMVTALIVEE